MLTYLAGTVMLYQPSTTPHVVLGVSVSLYQGRTYITASYNGQRVITKPAFGRIGDKLFIGGSCVPLLVNGEVKRGEIVV